jgi:hypothetical protein
VNSGDQTSSRLPNRTSRMHQAQNVRRIAERVAFMTRNELERSNQHPAEGDIREDRRNGLAP